MCGFAGFWYEGVCPSNSEDLLEKMGAAIYERGPDSSGVWLDSDEGIGLSHRRLSILDLSEAGHQPMKSHSERYVIAFNGEIYNNPSLREEVEAIKPIEWRGHSDTETLLAAFDLWGVESTLQKTIGMFAIALWDTEEKSIYLARDRFGEKPLYYTRESNRFLFGSELKCFRALSDFEPSISRDSISLLMRHNYIPAPYSIYKNVYKLMPGTFLKYTSCGEITINKYWDALDFFSDKAEKSAKSEVSIDSLESVLKASIRRQMEADVPLGAFLSGGIDSSLIVSLMQSMSDRPIKTFSIGFQEEAFNEAEYAKKVAEHLGTEHTELYVTADDALNVVGHLSDIYDEPFSDSSQIPTFLVSKMASEHVTVSLSGDAGDELFCGYNRYLMTDRLWKRLSTTPKFIRRSIAKVLLSISTETWNRFAVILPNKYKMSNLGDKLHKAANVVTCKDIDELYQRLVSHWHNPEDIVLGSQEPLTALTDPERKPNLSHPILNMMALDTLSYMTDDILVKVDRAAMANSLETRVPFLDHTVFEHAWKMPFEYKLREGSTKYCLREILYRYVPKELIERPKTGFGIPLDQWLRGPLKDWAENLISKERLQEEGFFDADMVTRMWNEHVSGERNWQYHLWDVLMFQSWYEKHHK
ncbi:asparagine synthase (glutamine-hydrolyzing) [Vibrio coralliilyticus]|uniref:asparagine synthase (glutamine-hydrolyzing) n=1 Tax=Vibrio coralliilyticus TaxID=190893 RepID=A0AAP7DF15_9VIBR|nr:asparagine synthase (glutamine-hydrolyzing) [Vibrio coralliilyticus]